MITGFRLARAAPRRVFGIHPDLTVLGKIIGGGMPVGAYGGRAELMELVAPRGPVYQAGTLSGHPLTMAAGIAALRQLTPDRYEVLEATSARLEAGLAAGRARRGSAVWPSTVPARCSRSSSGRRLRADGAAALSSDREAYAGSSG